jgi:HAD superfamily hydrolase (TIGR01493 family)
MAKLLVKGIVFDMYGTIVDLGAVASVCNGVTPDPLAFNTLWRAKQLEYTFLRSLMGRYRDFWKVTEEALEFTLQRFAIQVTSEQRRHLMDAWLHPSPYPEVAAALPRLKEKYLLAILSNGTAKMLLTGVVSCPFCNKGFASRTGRGVRTRLYAVNGDRLRVPAVYRSSSACALKARSDFEAVT